LSKFLVAYMSLTTSTCWSPSMPQSVWGWGLLLVHASWFLLLGAIRCPPLWVIKWPLISETCSNLFTCHR
jgi:hypothetical protein